MKSDILFAVGLLFLMFPLSHFCISGALFFSEVSKFIYNLGCQMFPDKYLTFKEWFQRHRKIK